MKAFRLLVGVTAVVMFSPLSASAAPLNTFSTTKPETTPPLHGTLPHGEGTVAVTQVAPDPTRPYSSDPSGKSAPSELLVVGRSLGERRADGTYHGHITIAAIAGIELLMIDTNPGETKQGPLDSLTNGLCSSTAGVVCLGVVKANSTTTTTGSINHFETANLSIGSPAGVTLPAGLAAVGAQAATSDGKIQTDATTGCQTASGASMVTKAGLGALILADVIKSSTMSKACPGQTPSETDTSTVIPTTSAVGNLLTTIPNNQCAAGGGTNADGSVNGTPNTVGGIPLVLDLVCNAADQSPNVATNSSDGAKQATSPYGVREALDAFVLAIGSGAAVKLTTAASESTATAQTVSPGCPPGQIGTPPNCSVARTPSHGICYSGGDNDCVSGNAQTGMTGPGIAEGGSTDTARDCKSGSEGTKPCGAPTGTTNTVAGPAIAQLRDTLPFTGRDVLPLGVLGLALLGTGLAMRSFSGLRD